MLTSPCLVHCQMICIVGQGFAEVLILKKSYILNTVEYSLETVIPYALILTRSSKGHCSLGGMHYYFSNCVSGVMEITLWVLIRIALANVVGTYYNRLTKGDSNEYPQRMFLCGRADEKYSLIIIKYFPYLFHCLLQTEQLSSEDDDSDDDPLALALRFLRVYSAL